GNFNNYLCGYAKGKGITEIVIPEGVDGIENYTFARDEDIKTLYLPSTIRSLGPVSFEWCENFEFIYGPGASDDNKCYVINDTLCLFAEANTKEYTTPHNVKYINNSVFQNKTQIEKITFSDEVLSVGSFQIWGCRSLKTITYSARTTRLCNDAFFTGYNVLEDVYLRASIPPSIYQCGDFVVDNNVSIYVPEESLQVYLNSYNWIPYREYIKGYKYTDLPKPDYYTSTDYSQDGVITTLQTATKGNGIDIVLMGDAYSDRQIADGTYRTDMEYIYNNLFTEEPYKSFKDYFNVHYVNVVSATEGYEYGYTALSGFFGDGTLVGGDDNAVFNYALNAISENDMNEALLIVAMNSDAYAGTCYMYYPDNYKGYGNGVSVAYFPHGGDETTFAQLLHHEACGHGFAKLADEYAYEYMGTIPSDYASQTLTQQESWGWWKNVDFTNDLSQIRWSCFLNDSRYQYDGLGAYEGGLTYWSGVWRPTENSIMRYNTGGFNAPSREAIYYRIHKLAYGDSWQYDYEEFVEWDARNRKAEADMSRAPYRAPANFKHTAPPVVINKSWRDAK
ncbi:MAG: leucine-rich repeat protein, partial [Muribaculaceae bacterium]|nr:leucine-rich repeat protein [Muribaculaceae bacterium]